MVGLCYDNRPDPTTPQRDLELANKISLVRVTIASFCYSAAWAYVSILGKTFQRKWFIGLVFRLSIQNLKSKIQNYLMTWSALAKTFGGIVRPICLAAFRLMMNSNFVMELHCASDVEARDSSPSQMLPGSCRAVPLPRQADREPAQQEHTMSRQSQIPK